MATSTKTKFKKRRIASPDFNLAVTLDSGQVFGFEKEKDGTYRGSIYGRPVRLFQEPGLELQVESVSDLADQRVRDYFDLERDLAGVYSILDRETVLRPALKAYRGLRLIRQDAWEALACFIISSNNNVKRIQGIWKNLIEIFGSFPTPGQIARSHVGILREAGLGYRAPFLYSTSRFVFANPVCLDVIQEASYEDAVRRVGLFPGIGPKVADCVLLYGFQKYEAFPVDVWILRIMRRLYFRGRSIPEKKIQGFAQKRWGRDAGYVQQYLFHSARTGVLS